MSDGIHSFFVVFLYSCIVLLLLRGISVHVIIVLSHADVAAA